MSSHGTDAASSSSSCSKATSSTTSSTATSTTGTSSTGLPAVKRNQHDDENENDEDNDDSKLNNAMKEQLRVKDDDLEAPKASTEGKNHNHHTNKNTGARGDRDPTLAKIASWIEGSDRIAVVTGAGVSVAAGIPDFRTPGTGLYDNLQKYQLPYAEAVFDLEFYQSNPRPFLSLARELWPRTAKNASASGSCPTTTTTSTATRTGTRTPSSGQGSSNQPDNDNDNDHNEKFRGEEDDNGRSDATNIHKTTTSEKSHNDNENNNENENINDSVAAPFLAVPTLTHTFLKLLQDRNKLLRIYTQNIDGLELLAGVDTEHLVECHGHFRTASCTRCKHPMDGDVCRKIILETNNIPLCRAPPTKRGGKPKLSSSSSLATPTMCGGYVKPDIVFFGEDLPKRFHQLLQSDVSKADLVIVLGTSLQVQPVSLIPDLIQCSRRVLLNRERVGTFALGGKKQFPSFLRQPRRDDQVALGDCDASITALAELLGWDAELRQAHSDTRRALLGTTTMTGRGDTAHHHHNDTTTPTRSA